MENGRSGASGSLRGLNDDSGLSREVDMAAQVLDDVVKILAGIEEN